MCCASALSCDEDAAGERNRSARREKRPPLRRTKRSAMNRAAMPAVGPYACRAQGAHLRCNTTWASTQEWIRLGPARRNGYVLGQHAGMDTGRAVSSLEYLFTFRARNPPNPIRGGCWHQTCQSVGTAALYPVIVCTRPTSSSARTSQNAQKKENKGRQAVQARAGLRSQKVVGK